jgi:hypothetical protein
MRYKFLTIFLLISLSGFSQNGLTMISEKEIPESMKFKGKIISCSRWADSLGINYLILSQTQIIKPETAIKASKDYTLMNFNGRIDTVYSAEADYQEKEIYAYQYIQTGDSIYLLWKLLDYVRECPFDLTLDYLVDKPIITDLDKNNVCETWLVYWLGCRSDVSANFMKLIMHNGKDKYAIRGTRKIRYGLEPDQIDGGEFKMDDSFKKLPKLISDYSKIIWDKYKMESY